MSDNLPATQVHKLGSPVASIDQAMELSKLLASSSIMPRDLMGKPANVMLVLMWGAELNLGPAQAIASISVISGRPVLSGQLWLAKTREAGHQVTFTEEYNDRGEIKSVTTVIIRGDDGTKHESTFSLHDAVQARLIKLSDDGKVVARSQSGNPLPWELYTSDLMTWRSVSRACRRACPEVAMHFLAEGELAPDEEPTPVATVVEHVTVVTQDDIQAEVAAIANEYVDATIQDAEELSYGEA